MLHHAVSKAIDFVQYSLEVPASQGELGPSLLCSASPCHSWLLIPVQPSVHATPITGSRLRKAKNKHLVGGGVQSAAVKWSGGGTQDKVHSLPEVTSVRN